MFRRLLALFRRWFLQHDRQFTHKLVIYTVGGTPEPIVASLLSECPERMIFVSSSETKAMISGLILPMLGQKGFTPLPAQYEVVVVPDAEEFDTCVQTARSLEKEVTGWLQRGPEFTLAVDLTGGTKCMSSALALVASRWRRAEFLYVGGQERNKAGVGVVVSGAESVFRRTNPWDSLGYQAIEEGSLFFDQGLYASASVIFDDASQRVTRLDVKRVLATLKILADVYNNWDRFDFNRAKNGFAGVKKNLSDLRDAFPISSQGLERTLQEHEGVLAKILEQKPNELWVRDLLANAGRRASQGNYDDATARLYRAVEAHAQVALTRHGLTSKTELNRLPPILHDKWRSRAQGDGILRLGLRDLYDLLSDLGDPLGTEFTSSPLAGSASPLEGRNNSILAHGFAPVTQKGFRSLWVAVLQLVRVKENELVSFPKLRPVE